MAETKIDLGKKGTLIIANREFTPDEGTNAGTTYKYIDVRIHAKGKEGGLFATKTGVTFRAEHADEVITGIRTAKVALEAGAAAGSSEDETEPF